MGKIALLFLPNVVGLQLRTTDVVSTYLQAAKNTCLENAPSVATVKNGAIDAYEYIRDNQPDWKELYQNLILHASIAYEFIKTHHYTLNAIITSAYVLAFSFMMLAINQICYHFLRKGPFHLLSGFSFGEVPDRVEDYFLNEVPQHMTSNLKRIKDTHHVYVFIWTVFGALGAAYGMHTIWILLACLKYVAMFGIPFLFGNFLFKKNTHEHGLVHWSTGTPAIKLADDAADSILDVLDKDKDAVVGVGTVVAVLLWAYALFTSLREFILTMVFIPLGFLLASGVSSVFTRRGLFHHCTRVPLKQFPETAANLFQQGHILAGIRAFSTHAARAENFNDVPDQLHANPKQWLGHLTGMFGIIQSWSNTALRESLVAVDGMEFYHELRSTFDEYMNQAFQGGKMNRGMCVLQTIQNYGKGGHSATVRHGFVAAWLVEILNSCFLTIDDVQDQSPTRRGKTARHLQVGNSNAMMEGTIFINMINNFINSAFGDALELTLRKLIEMNTIRTGYGQYMDNNVQVEGYSISERFTVKRWEVIVKQKTGFYTFYLPLMLGVVIANEGNPFDEYQQEQVMQLALRIGEWFQAQDDVIDVYGNEKVTGKQGTDIKDGKCSWLIVHAFQELSTAKWRNEEGRKMKQILEENYGYGQKDNGATEDIKHAQAVLEGNDAAIESLNLALDHLPKSNDAFHEEQVKSVFTKIGLLDIWKQTEKEKYIYRIPETRELGGQLITDINYAAIPEPAKKSLRQMCEILCDRNK